MTSSSRIRSSDHDDELDELDELDSAAQRHVGPLRTFASRVRHGDRQLVIAVAFMGFACLPAISAVVTRFGSDWLPAQDLALIDMRVRDVWTSEIPLSGAYSRFGWSHPGPILFYALAIPSLLSGGASWATLVGGAAFQIIAIAWTGVVAWKVARLALVVPLMTVLALAYASTGSWIVLEPWNPHIAFPWFVLFFLYTWRVSLGETNRVPGLVVASSVLAQLHVGYVPFVVGAGGVIAIFAVLDSRRGARWDLPRRSLVLATSVAVLLWLPVVVDAIVRPPGNLVEVLKFFARGSNGEPLAGWRSAVGLFGGQFDLPPQWIAGPPPLEPDWTLKPGPMAPALVAVVFMVVGFLSTRRTRRRDDFRLLVCVSCLSVVGVVTLARLAGEIAPYLFLWRIPLALLLIVSAVIAVWHAIRLMTPARRGSSIRLASMAIALVLVASVSIRLTDQVVTAGRSIHWIEPSLAEMLSQFDVEGLTGTSVMILSEGTTLGGAEAGVANRLDKAGVNVKVPVGAGYQWGFGREAGDREVDQTWVVIEESRLTSWYAANPSTRFIARVTPLDDATESELVALHERLRRQLVAVGREDLLQFVDSHYIEWLIPDIDGVSRDDVRRVKEISDIILLSGTCRCSIVMR